MPSSIRPTRSDVSDRFPVAGFTIRTGGPGYFEVAVATDPSLFQPEHQGDRNENNFYSTHGGGPLPADNGEAVYLLPQNVLARFAGHDRLYYSLATFSDMSGAHSDVVRIPSGAAPSILISRNFTGRRTAIGIPNRRGGLAGSSYGAATNGSMTWAGDAPAPGRPQPVAVAPSKTNGSNGKSVAAPPPAPAAAAPKTAAATAAAVDIPYDDGYGPLPSDASGGAAAGAQDDGPGIEGPIPDAPATSGPQAYVRPMEASEYPQASRFVPASTSNYRASTSPRAIRRCVIHITDGGSNINGPISWFQNPKAGVSAHYIVGQDGEVVQMVHHNDVAWHAHTANGDSIGIEHVANTRGLAPTDAQYCASAALVNWLCTQLGIDMNRTNILGHSEADPHTTHTGCPNAVWDWDYYMGLVTSATCYPRASAQGLEVRRKPVKPLNWATQHPKSKPFSSRALDDDQPDSGDGGYFKDTDKLTEYLRDERAADTNAISTKEDAKAVIDAFRAETAASPWTSLDRGQVADRLADLIDDPRQIHQGALNLCGPAVFFCMWNARDPVGFARFATQLFDNGRASIGSMNVAPSRKLLTKDYSQMVPLMKGDVTTQADWMVMGALRNSEDVFWQGTWTGDPRQELPGLTRPEELAAWMKATGVWKTVRNEANWATNKGVQHAIDLQIFKGWDTALLVNANLLVAAHPIDNTCGQDPGAMPENNWILKQFPNHFVMLLSEIVRNEQADTLEFGIWSWGHTLPCLSVPTKAFTDNYYGAVIGQMGFDRTQALGMTSTRKPQAKTAGLNGGRKHEPRRSSPLDYNIIRPMYTPSDPEEAKRLLAEWSGRRQRWAAGVQNTTIYPHSAICRFAITQSDGEYIGTGFYIDQDLVLTCAHNVHDATSITIIPGKNDLASTAEPFGRFTVDSSAWTIHPQYDPHASTASDRQAARNFDLAVIRVSTPPPNGWYFPVLEELTQSQPSPIIVCGYAAEDVDADRQHMDGDQIVTVEDDRFEYDIQTTGGSSGSPVFYLYTYDDDQRQQCVTEYHVVGVHTHLGIDPATGAKSDTVNGGCRLTQAKIQWINSMRTRATGMALGVKNGRKPVHPAAALAAAKEKEKHHHHPHTHAHAQAVEVEADVFSDAAVQRMRAEATGNAARAAASTDTVTFLNAALRQLFNSALRNADGTDKPLGATVQDTMSALQGYGLALPKNDFEFADPTGALTRGAARPDHLRDSVEDWIAHDPDPDPHPDAGAQAGWECYGISLLDGYHGVILAHGGNGAGPRLYWIDQINGGFDDVTGKLDQRIASLTQKWWDPQDAARKPRTRVSVWPLTPGGH